MWFAMQEIPVPTQKEVTHMQSRSKLLLSAACAGGLLLAPGASALAQDPARSGYPAQQPNEPLADKKLDQFVDAYADVQTIRKKFVSKINNVEDQSKVQAMQQQAQSEMLEAVKDSGLSVGEYNRIASMMDTNPELRQQVIERVEQR
jgi:hypothetical protein